MLSQYRFELMRNSINESFKINNTALQERSTMGVFTFRFLLLIFIVTQTSLSGQTFFKQSYDVVGDMFTKGLHTNTLDGGFIILTRSSQAFSTIRYFTIFKTEMDGDLEWSKRFIAPGNCTISNIVQSPDSGYFFCFVELNFAFKYYVVKLDKLGNLLFCKSITPPPNYLIAYDPQCVA